MTTCFNDLDLGIWFSLFAAHHNKVFIDKAVIIDMTEGFELAKFEKILANIEINGHNNRI